MPYEPVTPETRVEPQRLANDTWLIRQVQQAAGAPLFVYLNSLVVLGDEPLIVDTGTIANRSQWLDDVFGIVDPADVRWIFLSHDDIDHTGNLGEVLAACPQATVLGSWAFTERNANALDTPLHRTRWVDDGDEIHLADRRLRVVRPPLFDAPTTRGLFDERTGVYWAVDAFATPMPGAPVDDAADIDGEAWRGGMTMFAHHALSAWLRLVDPTRFAPTVERIRALSPEVIASAHSPVLTGPGIDAALAFTAELPTIVPPPAPDQTVLDEILAATAVPTG